MSNPQAANEKTVAEASAWVIKRGDDSFSLEEHKALTLWRGQSPGHEAAYQDALATWEQLRLLDNAEVAEIAEIAEDAAPVTPSDKLDGVRPQPAAIARKPRHRMAWRSLAAAMLLFLAGGAYFYAEDSLIALQADYATAAAETEQVDLADGSEILLNRRSAVQVNYHDDRRVVKLLKGEAIFSVASDPARPFVVNGDQVEVRALGTRFIVREHRGATKITALEHSIEVTVKTDGNAKNPKVVLRPVQSLRVRDDGSLSAVTEENRKHVTAWTRGRLVFQKRPLVEVLAEIDRHTGGRTILMNDALARQPVSGVFFLDKLDAAGRRIAVELQAEYLKPLPGVTLIY